MGTKEKRRKKKRVKMTKGVGVKNRMITVPIEISDRMNDFQSDHHVNWSNIASKAFEQYMDDHETD